MVTWYWSADSLLWQVSIDHNMMPYIKKVHCKPARLRVSVNLLFGGFRHLARLHRRRRRRRRRAYAFMSNTASHHQHEKINSWVSFSFPYEYGAPLELRYKTNKFHVAVRLFSNRSRMTSKCGMNISDTLGYALCAIFLFLPHFDVMCDLLLNRPAHGNMESIY